MSFISVKFLEKPIVIKFIGLALILAPFINLLVQLNFIRQQGLFYWYEINVFSYLKTIHFSHYVLAAGSIILGIFMLSGKKQMWNYVLILVFAHLAMQLLSYKSPIWKTYYPWLSLMLNLGLIFFITDQIIFRIDIKTKPNFSNNMYTEKKILLQAENEKYPWGVVQSLSQYELVIKKINHQYQVEIPQHKSIDLYLENELWPNYIYKNEDEHNIYYQIDEKSRNNEFSQKLLAWFQKIRLNSHI